MIYKNSKTGAMIDSPCELKGGHWELVKKSSGKEKKEEKAVSEEENKNK